MAVPFQPPPQAPRPAPQRRRGLLSAILDPDFENFVTPIYMSGVYRGYLIFSSLGSSVFLMFLIGFRGWIGDFLLCIGIGMALSAWYVSALTARMACEYLIILFKIHGEIVAFHGDMEDFE